MTEVEQMLKAFKNGESVTRTTPEGTLQYNPTERNISVLGLYQEGRINTRAACLNQMDSINVVKKPDTTKALSTTITPKGKSDRDKLRDLQTAINTLEGVSIPFNIIKRQIVPLSDWLDEELK